MSIIDEKIEKWEEVLVEYKKWLSTLPLKNRTQTTIYTQLTETFEAVIRDFKQIKETENENSNIRM